MEVEMKVLTTNQIPEILNYERARLGLEAELEAGTESGPEGEELNEPKELNELNLTAWDAVWRKEALEHYVPLGWSFGAWKDQKLSGYLLAQPFLFFRGMTQSLWVEHLNFNNPEVGSQLVDLIVGWGRSKHMQKVIFSKELPIEKLSGAWPLKKMTGGEQEIFTTKQR